MAGGLSRLKRTSRVTSYENQKRIAHKFFILFKFIFFGFKSTVFCGTSTDLRKIVFQSVCQLSNPATFKFFAMASTPASSINCSKKPATEVNSELWTWAKNTLNNPTIRNRKAWNISCSAVWGETGVLCTLKIGWYCRHKWRCIEN